MAQEPEEVSGLRVPWHPSFRSAGEGDRNAEDYQAKVVAELMEAKQWIKGHTFEEACAWHIDLIRRGMCSRLKQKFYGSVNSMSFKAKPRSPYKPAYALKVFQACLEPEIQPFWSKGYLSNITEWVEAAQKLIAGETVTRTDGRFGSVLATRSGSGGGRGIYRASTSTFGRGSYTNPLLNALLYGTLRSYERQGYYSDSDSDSEEDGYSPQPYSTVNPAWFHPPPGEGYPFHKWVKDENSILQFPGGTKVLKIPHAIMKLAASFNVALGDLKLGVADNDGWIREIHFVCYDPSDVEGTRSCKIPAGVELSVNGKAVPLTATGADRHFGYDITEHVSTESTNTLNLTSKNCVCGHRFSVVVVHSRPLSYFTGNGPASKRTATATLERMKASSDSGIEQLHTTVSLMCPLGQTFIETPVVGPECTHLQCFDLETFLLCNVRHPTWKCPVCGKSAKHNNLILHEFMKDVLEKVGSDDNGESVKVTPEGKWEVFEQEFEDHSESESEGEGGAGTKRKRTSSVIDPTAPKKRRVVPAPQKEIIDLT